MVREMIKAGVSKETKKTGKKEYEGMNKIEMMLLYELKAKRVEYKRQQTDAEFELAETKEILDSLSIYTKAINKTVQQFETKPMFVESLVKKLDIVDIEALEKKKGELEAKVVRWDVDALEKKEACHIAAVNYPYKRLVVEDYTRKETWGETLALVATCRTLEEEMVLNSIWDSCWTEVRRVRWLGEWMLVSLMVRKPDYGTFQEKTRKVLEKHLDWYTKRQPDAFEAFRFQKMKECLGQMTEEQYAIYFADLMEDVRKYNQLSQEYKN